jgi:hypothetical protein
VFDVMDLKRCNVKVFGKIAERIAALDLASMRPKRKHLAPETRAAFPALEKFTTSICWRGCKLHYLVSEAGFSLWQFRRKDSEGTRASLRDDNIEGRMVRNDRRYPLSEASAIDVWVLTVWVEVTVNKLSMRQDNGAVGLTARQMSELGRREADDGACIMRKRAYQPLRSVRKKSHASTIHPLGPVCWTDRLRTRPHGPPPPRLRNVATR